ncbi:glycosyltransferase family 4 protein [Thermocrinis sp.]
MRYLIIAFLVSLAVSYIFTLFKHEYLIDTSKGVQKFHKELTPRVGGLAIFIACLFSGMFLTIFGKPFGKEFLILFAISFPVFIAGFAEDITKKVSPKVRLFSAFVSGILAVVFLSAGLKEIDVPILDYLLTNSEMFSLFFTAFALAGMANAMNIIDGFNGLAGGVSIIIFFSYAYVSFLLQDEFLLYLSLIMASAIFGFFLLNFPFGKIFLGDSGSYLIGFVAGLEGVLLVKRHPEVSPWFVLMLLAYPVFETIFSIYRKKFLRKLSPFDPDAIHLHMLIYKRIIRKKYKTTPHVIRNSLTSPYLWGFQIIASIPALLFWKSTAILVLSFLAFCIFYVWFYFRIVRFKLRL